MENTPGKARILLVDDEPISLALAARLLEDEYEVLGCADGGSEGLRRAREELPDLVLTDIVMPDINGYDLCRLLKEDALTRDIPVIFLSGTESLESYLAGHDVGGEDFLAKPVQITELRHMVAHTLRVTEERRRLAKDAQYAFQTAMTAMSSAAEFGVVLQFIRGSYNCRDYATLADVAIAACGEYGLTACLRLSGRLGIQSRNRVGASSALETGILERMTGFGRIVDFSHRTAINYDHVTLMITDMPVDDAERYGRLRDHLAILAESIDARVQALDDSVTVVAKHVALGNVVHQTQAALADIDQRHRTNQNDARMILMNMLTMVEQSFAHLGMTTSQEDFLVAIINKGVQDIMDLLDQGLSIDNHLSAVQDALEKSETLVSL
jgi:CheY-like chemotaxis protein